MKKNLLLLLTLVAFSGSISAMENNNQNAPEPAATPETIKFTEEEYYLLNNSIRNFDTRNDSRIFFQIGAFDPRFLLSFCGWSSTNHAESYDPKIYPDCAEVLAFFKHYEKEEEKLVDEYKKELKKLVKKFDKDKKCKKYYAK
jgi:hypothetical protein